MANVYVYNVLSFRQFSTMLYPNKIITYHLHIPMYFLKNNSYFNTSIRVFIQGFPLFALPNLRNQ